jgi:hypothetical protein
MIRLGHVHVHSNTIEGASPMSSYARALSDPTAESSPLTGLLTSGISTLEGLVESGNSARISCPFIRLVAVVER